MDLHQGWADGGKGGCSEGVTITLDSKLSEKRSKDRRGGGLDVTSL